MSAKAGFLSLPLEIRKCVYEYILVYKRSIYPLHTRFCYDTKWTPGILRTSRLLYQEASSFLYSENIFYVKAPHLMSIWLQTIGPSNAATVNNICFQLDYTCSESKKAEWLTLVDELSQAATGLRHANLLCMFNCAVNSRTRLDAPRDDLAQFSQSWGRRFVRRFVEIRQLSQVRLLYYYPEDWPRYLSERMAVKVVEGDRSAWSEAARLRWQEYRRLTAKGALYDCTES